jgi:hypothetical protein
MGTCSDHGEQGGAPVRANQPVLKWKVTCARPVTLVVRDRGLPWSAGLFSGAAADGSGGCRCPGSAPAPLGIGQAIRRTIHVPGGHAAGVRGGMPTLGEAGDALRVRGATASLEVRGATPHRGPRGICCRRSILSRHRRLSLWEEAYFRGAKGDNPGRVRYKRSPAERDGVQRLSGVGLLELAARNRSRVGVWSIFRPINSTSQIRAGRKHGPDPLESGKSSTGL